MDSGNLENLIILSFISVVHVEIDDGLKAKSVLEIDFLLQWKGLMIADIQDLRVLGSKMDPGSAFILPTGPVHAVRRKSSFRNLPTPRLAGQAATNHP
jgi:hypothetical protein